MLPFTSHAQFKPLQGPSPILSDAGAPKSIVFPHCQIDHGICASLLGSLPFAIVGVQFVRNGVDAVQDAVVIFNNTRAEALFAAQDSRTLKGAMFLTTFGNILPFGLW